MDLNQVTFTNSVKLQSIRTKKTFHKVTYLLIEDKVSAKAVGIQYFDNFAC